MIKIVESEFPCRAVENVMNPLAKKLEERMPDVSFVISYDPYWDFYHLIYSVGNRLFDIRWYKVLSVSIDGKDGWIGCPREREFAFIDYLVKESKLSKNLTA